MRDWLLRLQLKYKLLFAFGSILVMSLILMAIGVITINRILSFQDLQQNANVMRSLALRVEGDVNEFTFVGFKDTEFLEAGANAQTQDINQNLDSISVFLNEFSLESSISASEEIATMSGVVDRMKVKFGQLITLYQERGFKDAGLEGELRSAIHAVEDTQYPYDRVSMLMLRRHEKDFFLRKDLKYVDKFNKEHASFMRSIELDDYDNPELKSSILKDVETYRVNFSRVVDLEKQIGLTADQGISGELRDTVFQLLSQVELLSTELYDTTNRLVSRSIILLVILLLVQLAIGSVLAILYANIMTRAVNEVKGALTQLSQGTFPEQLLSRTKDELSELKNSLNLLVDRIKTAVDFATAIGKGDLHLDYDSRYNDDVLARAITEMQDKLKDAETRQQIINWTNEGIAALSELLHDESIETEALGRKILNIIVKHVELNQAALYLINDEATELHRIATYAYGKQRFEEHNVSIETGLIGQALKEHSAIYLKEVPDNYTRITSGLGHATPKTVFIIPLEVREEGVGVLELAAFTDLKPHEKEFLQRAAETIAAAIRGRQMTEETRNLLEQTEEKAQTLSAQEEELRQNTEELVATQEEMQRQRRELEGTIDSLKSELNLREKEIRSLTT